MLPKKITGHPYFHQEISKEEAGELLKTLPEEGNCLFCEDKEDEDKFFFVYRTSCNEIKTLQLRLENGKSGEIRCVTDYIMTIGPSYSSLYDFIKLLHEHREYVSQHEKLKKIDEQIAIVQLGYLPEKFEVFKDQPLVPVLNPTAKKHLDYIPLPNSMLPPLPNEIVSRIFEYLDNNSSFNAARVSKSWYGLFHLNLNSVAKAHHNEIKNEEDKEDALCRVVYE